MKLKTLLKEITVQQLSRDVQAAIADGRPKYAEKLAKSYFKNFIGKNLSFGKIETIEVDTGVRRKAAEPGVTGPTKDEQDFLDQLKASGNTRDYDSLKRQIDDRYPRPDLETVDAGVIYIDVDVQPVTQEDIMKVVKWEKENPNSARAKLGYNTKTTDIAPYDLINLPPELQILKDAAGRPVVIGPAIVGSNDPGFNYYGQNGSTQFRYFALEDELEYSQTGAYGPVNKIPLTMRDIALIKEIIKIINPESNFKKFNILNDTYRQ